MKPVRSPHLAMTLQRVLNICIIVSTGLLLSRFHGSKPTEFYVPEFGDDLKRLPLAVGSAHIPYTSETCTAFVFVRSSCPACQRVAPDYSGHARVQLGGEAEAALVWVGFANDREYWQFIGQHELNQGVQLKDPEANAWGIDRVPLMYVVDQRGALLAVTHPAPHYVANMDLGEFADRCGDGRLR